MSSAEREVLKNQQYLHQWKTDRNSWRFNKLRQISIQKGLFSQTQPMDDALWQLALDYLSGTKGHGREVLIKAAETVINEIDERINAENQHELVSQTQYTRARELLQMFQ